MFDFKDPSESISTGSLQIAGGVGLDGTLRFVEDQDGNDSVLSLSTAGVAIGSGAITANGILTLKSSGGNILSLRDNTNTEKAYFTNSGIFYLPFLKITGAYAEVQATGFFQVDSRLKLGSPSDGIAILSNYGGSNFTRLVLGTNNIAGASLVKNGTAIQIKDGDGTNFTTLEALEILTRAPGSGTAARIKFGSKIDVTEAALTSIGINMQQEVEIDNVTYYMLGSTVQLP